MTESEYINYFKSHWPKDFQSFEPTKETIELTERAVKDFPNSAKLWVIRGDLLQLINFECEIPLEESQRCYFSAIKADPNFIEAYEEMGYFIDAILGKPRKAKQYFNKAKILKRKNKINKPIEK